MSVREYVGARYVPIIVGEWDNTKTYEPLMVVTYQGNSYTSRQYVPTGIEITNESYWILSANYNAQVEAYRQEVSTFDNRITTNTTANAEHTNQLAGTTDSGLKTLVNAEHTTNVTQDAQLAGTSDSGLKTLITNESTARGTKDTAIDAQLAGTTNSGLKTLIDANTTANAEHTNQLAGTDDSGLKTLIETNANSINNINNQGYQQAIYGICHNHSNNNQWFYISTSDMKNINYIDVLPSRNTTYDYSNASNLFEKNGVLYYPQDAHKDIFATTDGKVWNENYGINYPAPLGNNFYQWAPMLFEDASGNVKFALARQYNDIKIINATNAETFNFRIDVFDCTIIDNKINISNNYITIISDGSHIDPYIIYDANYGYVMACKNEETCLIEIYNGSSLSNMSLKFTTRLVGCEAPKLIKNNGAIILYSEGYSISTGAGNSITNHFYFTNTISFSGSELSYGPLNVFNMPKNYQHVALIQNSSVLAKYAKNKTIIPFTSPIPNVVQIVVPVSVTDIYPITAPFHISFNITGGGRTITVHKPIDTVLNCTINYIVCQSSEPMIISNGMVTHTMTDGEVMPCFTLPSYMLFEKK